MTSPYNLRYFGDHPGRSGSLATSQGQMLEEVLQDKARVASREGRPWAQKCPMGLRCFWGHQYIIQLWFFDIFLGSMMIHDSLTMLWSPIENGWEFPIETIQLLGYPCLPSGERSEVGRIERLEAGLRYEPRWDSVTMRYLYLFIRLNINNE